MSGFQAPAYAERVVDALVRWIGIAEVHVHLISDGDALGRLALDGNGFADNLLDVGIREGGEPGDRRMSFHRGFIVPPQSVVETACAVKGTLTVTTEDANSNVILLFAPLPRL